VGGYTHWHAALEAALAELKGTEDCLLFPTGFAANLAVASAVCEAGSSSGGGGGGNPQQAQQQQQGTMQPAMPAATAAAAQVVVLSDELNHASIVDGARLGRRAGARLLVYRHNDLAHLEQLLETECPPGGSPAASSCYLIFATHMPGSGLQRTCAVAIPQSASLAAALSTD